MNQPESQSDAQAPRFEALSAVTLATHDMERAVAFYLALGFPLSYGGPFEAFTSFCSLCGGMQMLKHLA